MPAEDVLFVVGLPILGFAVAILIALSSIGRQLDLINRKLDLNRIRDKQMSKELDELTAEVAETSGHIDSAVVLIQGIAARIEAAGANPAKLKALTEELNAKSEALAAAVEANSPPAEPTEQPVE